MSKTGRENKSAYKQRVLDKVNLSNALRPHAFFVRALYAVKRVDIGISFTQSIDTK
jgi:hypothetical protein